METLGADCMQCVLSFLTHQDAVKVATLSDTLENEVRKHTFYVYYETSWQESAQEKVITKDVALQRMGELKKATGPTVVLVKVTSFYINKDFMANSPTFESKWKRGD